VEVKYRSADHGRLRRLLLERGAREDPPAEQEDVYLRHPTRDFARTNEAFRLRRDGGENRITYKGPRLPAPTKTREEIEIALAGGEAAFHDVARLFENLGFHPVAAIRKRRTKFHLTCPPHEIEIALDRVAGSRSDVRTPGDARGAILDGLEASGMEEVVRSGTGPSSPISGPTSATMWP
jgi:adenylate cyclase class 2